MFHSPLCLILFVCTKINSCKTTSPQNFTKCVVLFALIFLQKQTPVKREKNKYFNKDYTLTKGATEETYWSLVDTFLTIVIFFQRKTKSRKWKEKETPQVILLLINRVLEPFTKRLNKFAKSCVVIFFLFFFFGPNSHSSSMLPIVGQRITKIKIIIYNR